MAGGEVDERLALVENGVRWLMCGFGCAPRDAPRIKCLFVQKNAKGHALAAGLLRCRVFFTPVQSAIRHLAAEIFQAQRQLIGVDVEKIHKFGIINANYKYQTVLSCLLQSILMASGTSYKYKKSALFGSEQWEEKDE